MNKKHFLVSKLISLHLLIILFSCQKNEVKVGVAPTLSSSGIFIAQERGYFKDEGLKVSITLFRNSGASMTTLLSSGELHVGGGNLTSGLWEAMNQETGIKIVADKGHVAKDTSSISLIVRTDHLGSGRYQKLKDLKGFTFGFTSLGGVTQQIILDRFLKKAGLSLKDTKSIKFSYGEMNIALKQKQIDAAIQLEPYVSEAIHSRTAKVVATAYEVHPNQQSAAILYSARFIKDHPEKAIAFMRAYLKGVRDYNKAFIKNDGREEIIGLLKKYINIESPEIWATLTPVGLNPNGFINRGSLQEDLLWYKAQNFLSKVPPLDQIVDHTFIDLALKDIGKE